MGKKARFAVRVARFFDLPPETVSEVPRLTVTGCDSALVENHKGILSYDRERLEVGGGAVKLVILGEQLELTAMDHGELTLRGQLLSVVFEQEGTGGKI